MGVTSIEDIRDFLNNVYNDETLQIVVEILSILNNKYEYLNINDSISDLSYVANDYTTNDLVTIINMKIKNTILDVYNSIGFTVNIDEAFNLSLDKHLDILRSMILLDDIDLTNVFFISEILHSNDLDNLEKIFHIFSILNILHITISDFLNTFSDVHSKFFNNITNIIDKVSKDIVSVTDSIYSTDDINAIKEQNEILEIISNYLNTLSINTVNEDITNLIILPISKENTKDLLYKKYLTKIKLFDDMDDNIKREIIITFLVITLILENLDDKKDYLTITKLKLANSGLDTNIIDNMDVYFKENKVYSFIEEVNND